MGWLSKLKSTLSTSKSTDAEAKGLKPEFATDDSFRSLVERSISAWHSLNWVGRREDRHSAIKDHSEVLRSRKSLDDFLDYRTYWFFQLRSAFMRQDRLTKWDASRLGDYIVLPIDYGFVNNKDCYFISHYWREKDHPDRNGEDLRGFKEDIASDELWSYVWVDWTCMPQGNGKGERSEREKSYFKLMLTCIPMLVRDCAFEWRFPPHEPRAWVLYEIAEFILGHKLDITTDDNKTFINHVSEMVNFPVVDEHTGVCQILDKYGYDCTNKGDKRLVTGWLEILVILTKCFPGETEIVFRKEVLDMLNKPAVGSWSNPLMDFEIDKAEGTARHKGIVYNFTPIYKITSHI